MTRKCTGIVALALALSLAACGGDDEPGQRAGAGTAPEATTPTATVPAENEVQQTEELPPPEPGATGPDDPVTSPEDRPGGAGDEEPIRTRVVLELRDGRLSPRRVEVPPFIGVELIVRAPDGRRINLSVDGPRSAAGSDGTKAELELEGLRPDERYEIEENRTGATAVIVASAEPGP